MDNKIEVIYNLTTGEIELDDKEYDKIDYILDKMNIDMQLVVAIEELSELQKEITKVIRYDSSSLDNLAEEISDVEIMIKQLKRYYGIDNKKIIEYKLDRTIDRIKRKEI